MPTPPMRARPQSAAQLAARRTRDLIDCGVVADPHAPGAASPGSLPMVWRTTIYNRVWD
ncbi:hypothetical protein [Phenylobacterium sp.]|uniref:hypothetical protein n=1 Tax=Phenylobacterium sp. TaxID=1871053 RepID=UPI002F42B89D